MLKVIRSEKQLSFSIVFSSLSFLGLLFCLTRQFPFSFVSSAIPIFMLLTLFSHFLLNYKLHQKVKFIDVIFLLTFLTSLLGYSLLQGNAPLLIIRFLLIISFINVVLLVGTGNINHLVLFKYIYLLQSIIIISFAIAMPILFDINSYGNIRALFLANKWGDIYTYNGVFYRIQVIGNALIPIFFFLTYINFRELRVLKRFFLLIISFLGCVFSGNLAFFLAIFIFVVVYELKSLGALGLLINKYKLLFLLFLSIITPIFIYYTLMLLEMKSDGDVSSIGTRFDQITVLINSMNISYVNLLFGNGVGHTLNVITPARDYTGDIYFELQALYFLNQLGFIPFTVLFLFHMYLFMKRVLDFKCRLIYFSYLFYASINPYFLDSSHIVVLLLILALNTSQFNKKSNLCDISLK